MRKETYAGGRDRGTRGVVCRHARGALGRALQQ